jgi:antitoxin MazE
MKTRIVPLGNSQGIRIPKLILEEAAMPEDVELEVVGDTIVIRPARKPREGWFDNIVVEPLSDEDLEWLNAPLSAEADKEWVWEGEPLE